MYQTGHVWRVTVQIEEICSQEYRCVAEVGDSAFVLDRTGHEARLVVLGQESDVHPPREEGGILT